MTRDGGQAIRQAAKRSRKDGRLRFVFATSQGFRTSLRRLPFQDCWWTNGVEVGIWKAYAPSGEVKG